MAERLLPRSIYYWCSLFSIFVRASTYRSRVDTDFNHLRCWCVSVWVLSYLLCSSSLMFSTISVAFYSFMIVQLHFLANKCAILLSASKLRSIITSSKKKKKKKSRRVREGEGENNKEGMAYRHMHIIVRPQSKVGPGPPATISSHRWQSPVVASECSFPLAVNFLHIVEVAVINCDRPYTEWCSICALAGYQWTVIVLLIYRMMKKSCQQQPD